jgi:uncharacterized lipoprotein YajG
MKKILVIAAIFGLFSCSYKDQRIALDLSYDSEKSNIGQGNKIAVKVLDERLQKNFIGSKEYCDHQKILIKNEQNLAEILKQELDLQLARKGFVAGNDKLLELRIERLEYKASCKYLVGKSEANILVKATITNNKTGLRTNRSFEVSQDGKHFLVPLASTVEDSINNILQDSVKEILGDDSLLKN